METLALLVGVIVLSLVSTPIITALLALPKNNVTRVLSYVVGSFGIIGGLWLMTVNPNSGTLTFAAWITVGNIGALYLNYTRSQL